MRLRHAGPGAAIALILWGAPAAADPILSLDTGTARLGLPASAIAEMDISESGGMTDIFLRLMPGAADDLARLTGAAIGRRLTLGFCGVNLMSPVIRARIEGGTIYIADTTMVRAEALRAVWHGRASCDTLGSEVFEETYGHGQ